MVLRKKWYYTDNYRILIYEGKNMVDYQKGETFIYNGIKLWYYTKTFEVFEQLYNFRTLVYYGKTMVLWKKYYDSVPKTMEL